MKEVEKRKNQRLIAICAVDEKKFFSVLYIFDAEEGVDALKVFLDKKKPLIPSVHDIFLSASVFEREVHDFFGIEFLGNPHLHEKLFLPDDWEGKPPLLKE